MKKIEAKIVADSINPQGDRITTYLLTFPRFILAELNTHRVFSKNSASSRAIPFEKMVKMVKEDPFIPIAWQKHHSGMQGNEYFTEECIIGNKNKPVKISKKRNLHYSAANRFKPLLQSWHTSRVNAIKTATELYKMGVTKQLCNRLLEPFMWHTVLLTGTEFENFFELRCPKYHTPVSGDGYYFKSKKDCIANHSNPINLEKLENMSDIEWLQINFSQAEIHMQALAEAMWDAMNESTPKELKEGEWHIPFGDKIDSLDSITDKSPIESLSKKINHTSIAYSEDIETLAIKISTARCARLSYMTFDGEIDYEKDLKLHDTLLESRHMSPFEHCARAMSENEYTASKLTGYSRKGKDNYGWCNNFKGFIQYRYLIENT